jgi:two-component sensor histidine kinase
VKPPDYTFDRDRLDALAQFSILDSPAEPGFDAIVELAIHVCHVPVALVSLVSSDRQWFKARSGFEPCETDLERSVCAFVLTEPDVLIIPDLTRDARTRNNPLVTHAPHIRFYAGAPLRTAEGHVLGSLCVIDDKPRPEGLTEGQGTALKNLARQVMAQLELRQAVVERDQALLLKLKADEQQHLLNHELSHRMKNTMSLVQAVASQTLKGVPDQLPVKAFSERLFALSAAHDILLQQNWSAARIEDVVATVFHTFGDATRFDMSGPHVTLASRATLSLSLLLHELTTNALKYGALSNASGRVTITWDIRDRENVPTFALVWREHGGPRVAEPTSKGFGTKLVRMGLAGTGSAEFGYPPDGFAAEFTAPLADLQA